MYKQILIDVSNLFYKNYFTHKHLNVEIEGKIIESGGIFGFLRSIQKIKREYATDSSNFYFLFDNLASKDLSRKNLDPDYKINREKHHESFYRALDYLRLILLNYSDNFFCLQIEGFEADDLPPALLKLFDPYDKILIISDDLDYARCISNNIDLLKNHQILNKVNFLETYKFNPSKENVILWKTFKGDSADNIPVGVPRLRENKILYLINKYKDIYNILENIKLEQEVLGEKTITQILENKARLILNHQLVDFIDISSELLQQNLHKSCYNPNSLRFFYKALKFQISDVDKRLMEVFPDNNTVDSFFEFEKVKRQ